MLLILSMFTIIDIVSVHHYSMFKLLLIFIQLKMYSVEKKHVNQIGKIHGHTSFVAFFLPASQPIT